MEKKKNWFRKHWIFSVILGMVLLVIGLGIIGGLSENSEIDLDQSLGTSLDGQNLEIDNSNNLDASDGDEDSDENIAITNIEEQEPDNSEIIENEELESSGEINLVECDFSDFNKPLEDLILTRSDLPEKYSAKNSWEEYEIPDETILSPISESKPEHEEYSIFGKRRRVNINLLTVGGPVYEIIEYKDVQSARESFKTILDESKKNENTKKETGAYGEERIEYARSYYIKNSYKIYFRIGDKTIDVSSWDPYNNVDADIEFAKLIHNKAC